MKKVKLKTLTLSFIVTMLTIYNPDFIWLFIPILIYALLTPSGFLR
jgi:hypothetical protein